MAYQVSRTAVLTVYVYDVRTETVRREMPVTVPPLEDPGFRMAVHRISDEVMRAVTGQGGIAATRFLFLQRGRIYRIDSDGADLQPVTAPGARTFSPSWSPSGRQVAYTEFHDQGVRLYVQEVEGGGRRLVGTTDRGLNYTPAFAPDGRTLLFSRSDEGGTDVFAYDVERDCCIQRLTSGRFADNLSPTFSPRVIPNDVQFVWSAKPRMLGEGQRYYTLYPVKSTPELTGGVITTARATLDPVNNLPIVTME